MAKQKKEDVEYGNGMIHSHCGRVFTNDNGYCEHFRGAEGVISDGICTEVQGSIGRVKWCKLWKKAKS